MGSQQAVDSGLKVASFGISLSPGKEAVIFTLEATAEMQCTTEVYDSGG
jgi:hypothetical protein